MSKVTNKYLFVSVKPEFAEKIVNREKTIELRKFKPNINTGDYIIIYASSPRKSVVAFGTIRNILKMPPQKMWSNFSSRLGIDKKRFDSYYKGKLHAIGIEFNEVVKIDPIHLSDLRNIDPQFHPPQIFKYISNFNNYRELINLMQLPP